MQSGNGLNTRKLSDATSSGINTPSSDASDCASGVSILRATIGLILGEDSATSDPTDLDVLVGHKV